MVLSHLGRLGLSGLPTRTMGNNNVLTLLFYYFLYLNIFAVLNMCQQSKISIPHKAIHIVDKIVNGTDEYYVNKITMEEHNLYVFPFLKYFIIWHVANNFNLNASLNLFMCASITISLSVTTCHHFIYHQTVNAFQITVNL